MSMNTKTVSQAVVQGIMFGDGFRSKNNQKLYLKKNDVDYLKFKRLSKYIGNMSDSVQDQRSYGNVHYINLKLPNEMLTYRAKRHIPAGWKEANIPTTKLKCAFLRGLYSANGHYAKKGIVLTATSRLVLEYVNTILQDVIGVTGNICVKSKETTRVIDNRIAHYKQNYTLIISKNAYKRDFMKHINFLQRTKRHYKIY